MRPSFYPRLVNGPFDDPGLFISFMFEKRAVLFDLGDIHSLSPKDILKISHVFVSHTHMDHFVGFDRLLRLLLGREKTLYLYGPEGFLSKVEGKLAGYSWDLVHNYDNRFALCAFEIRPESLLTRQYLCSNRFQSGQDPGKLTFSKVLVEEPALMISTEILDHSIPCLAYCIKERFHVNIKKEVVLNLGLDIGPWLNDFKQALYRPNSPDSLFRITTGNETSGGKSFRLKALADQIAIITPGQKVAYIADVAYSESNVEKIIEFAKDSDHLFIEAAFLEAHRDIAEKKHHLTARQAGIIAGKAGAKQFTIFHFSPRYIGMEALLYQEAREGYEEESSPFTG